MELISRGKVWQYYNGIAPIFDSLEEEANFFRMLGHTDEVRNPVNNLYLWTLEDFAKGIEQGIVDGFYMGTIPFSFGERTITAIRFRDQELGKRVREATSKVLPEILQIGNVAERIKNV